MTGRTIALTIVGFLVGMLAAGGIGVRVIEEVRAEDDATSLPAENVSQPSQASEEYFLDPDETLIASSIIVPISVVGSGPNVGIEYEISSLAPMAAFQPAGAPTLYPSSWSLTTESGTFDGGPDGPDGRIALFELPEGTDARGILAVEIVDPLVAYPLDAHFELSEEKPSTAITAGVRAQLMSVSQESEVTVVRLKLVAVDPIDPAFSVEGVGTGWSSDQLPRIDSTIELAWVGDEVPDIMTFRAAGIQWIELIGAYPISVEDL